jgi:hypothetical protein
MHEVAIIGGALELAATPAEAAMTPVAEVEALAADAPADAALLDGLLSRGAAHALVRRRVLWLRLGATESVGMSVCMTAEGWCRH